ncbi:lipopolysaccharide assembly protein LapA domain-containing protein [Sedimentitalea sp. HM32M-2]|uniref:lipopolysaccharide assembly protein LapA domain-containing protein n=1 Tax=Sedimentitalea sp. HM32M-2 TaxID=3351566 RepID=UPI003638E99C
MRYIRYAFLAALGIILVSVSLANRGLVPLKLMPDALAQLLGFNMSISLPLFMVVLGGIVAGLVIGFLWEWMREYKHRREATEKARQVRKLERQVGRLKTEKHQGKDEVLAILEETS